VEQPADPLDVIELATAVLVRNFELLRRRGAVHNHLDRAEYLLLRTLATTGPADICTLGAGLGLDPSTVGRQVSAMAGKGLVERRQDETDRRRTVVSPTTSGLADLRAERAARRAATATLLSGWAEQDLEALGDMFTRYNKAITEHYLDS
jgi:DNA-binding MarR family transcriptional regulator